MNEVKGEPKGYTDKSLITLSRESILGAEINRDGRGGVCSPGLAKILKKFNLLAFIIMISDFQSW